MVSVGSLDLNSGSFARIMVRFQDPDNFYAIELGADTGGGSGPIKLVKRIRGKEYTVDSDTYTTDTSVVVMIKASGSSIKAWVDTTLKIDTADSDIADGGVALAGEKPRFDLVKVGYDTNADDDIRDAGDDLVVIETFSSNATSFTYDDNGNLTNDGMLAYIYDPWNRLVRVTAAEDSGAVTIQTAKFDGLGRRIETERAQGGSVKLTNSGNLDGTTRYYYNNQQIIETNDGSGNLVTQMYHGTQYIDELVGMRLEHGRVYVHQDANYNVTDITDLTGRVLERYYYSPYGEPEVSVDAHFFDYDDDGDVDASDYAVTTNGTCAGTATGDCRRTDANADGVVDSSDQSSISDYISGLSSDTEIQRIPTASASTLDSTFAFEGLFNDVEIGAYNVRNRWYSPPLMQFGQPDPLTYDASMWRDDSHLSVSRSDYIPVPPFIYAASGFDDGLDLYSFSRANPFVWRDPYGTSCAVLTPAVCGGWPPGSGPAGPPPSLPPSPNHCDAYPSNMCYGGANERCVCMCMGNSTWSNLVRGCLACAHCNAYAGPTVAHARCFAYATALANMPQTLLASCIAQCRGGMGSTPLCPGQCRYNGPLPAPTCFVAGTILQTAKGPQSIESVRAGDLVYSWDFSSNEKQLVRVIACRNGYSTHTVSITIGTDTIECTPLHPFFVRSVGWAEAQALSTGDELFTKEGTFAKITRLSHMWRDTQVQVFVISVDQEHPYFFVTPRWVLAHNKPP